MLHAAESAVAVGRLATGLGARLERLVRRTPGVSARGGGALGRGLARRRLADVRLRALECYAETCLGLRGAELPGAERAARELVEAAPFRESGHLLLMRALAASGNVAEALAAYERLRVLLRDELGVNPSEAVQDEYVRLLG